MIDKVIKVERPAVKMLYIMLRSYLAYNRYIIFLRQEVLR